MENGFQIHKHAVVLECNLNNILKGSKTKEVIDITMVYAYPIRLTMQILANLSRKESQFEDRSKWIMEMIQVRYQPYESCILTQLDQPICTSLCKDLELLFEQMKIS